MSINPNRAQARLTATQDQAAKAEQEIKRLRDAAATESKDAVPIAESLALNQGKIEALKDAAAACVERIAGNTESPAVDDDVTQHKAALESIATLVSANLVLTAALRGVESGVAKLQDEAKSQEATMAFLLAKKASQEAALAAKEASYPKLLKRHLRRCKKFGWADARLTASKK